MTTTPNHCAECGSNLYYAANFERVRDKNLAIEERLKREVAGHARDRATWEIQRMDLANEQSYLQRKVREQTKVINRLEKRIRALKSQPYGDEP